MARCVDAGRLKKSTNCPFAPGVLIRQGGEDAVVRQQASHLVEIAFFRQHFLAGAFAEAAQEIVEIAIVEFARDGVRREAEQAENVAAHLPVAEMARHQQQRPARQQRVHELTAALQIEIAPPVRRVQLARNVDNFHQQHAEMAIHGAHPLVALSGVEIGEGVAQVLVGDVAMAFVEVIEQPGEPVRRPCSAAGYDSIWMRQMRMRTRR